MVKQKKEFNMKQVMTLWLKKSKSGMQYLSGIYVYDENAGNDGKVYVTGFINGKKKNPKEPDIRIYQNVQGEKCDDDYIIISLWCNVSRSGKKYFTGKIDDMKFVGFINSNATVDSKIPYITLYESNSEPPKKEEKKYTSGEGAPKKHGKKVAKGKPVETDEEGFMKVPEGAEELPF